MPIKIYLIRIISFILGSWDIFRSCEDKGLNNTKRIEDVKIKVKIFGISSLIRK